jgi:ribosomal protein S18
MGRGKFVPKRKVCPFCVEKSSYIDYKEPAKLGRFITDRGKIGPRRMTGCCAKHQRALAEAIKRARHLALLPCAPAHIHATGGVGVVRRARGRFQEGPVGRPVGREVEAVPQPAGVSEPEPEAAFEPEPELEAQPEPESEPEPEAEPESDVKPEPEPESEPEPEPEPEVEPESEANPEPEPEPEPEDQPEPEPESQDEAQSEASQDEESE